MSISIADTYFLKALSNYPWNVDEVTENLNYALSYDDGHAQAYCLMGRLHMEILKDFKEAEFYFEQAIINDLHYVDTYKWFSLLKIWTGEFDKARKIIAYGLKIKGMDRAILIHRKALISEASGHNIAAQKHMAYAMRCSLSDTHVTFFKDEISRIQDKVKATKKLEKKLGDIHVAV